MISIEAYRLAIGNFNNLSKQLNLRSICNGIRVGSYMTSSGISDLLKPSRFITLFFLSIIMLNSGNIETNPGPTFSIKTVQGSYHQNNPKYGVTAGIQCMCNSLASVCYAKVKQVHFWTTWDLDKILDFRNETYSSLGYTDEYLTFDELPSTFSMGDKVLELQKSNMVSGYLNKDSFNFLRIIPLFYGGVFTANGLGTSFISDGSSHIYIFDPHSRDNFGFVSPDGKSVLLKFETVSDTENFIKYIFLEQMNLCRL